MSNSHHDHMHIVIAPDPIFSVKTTPVASVTDDVRATVDAMFDVLYREKGVGIGANMVGITDRIAVVDLQEDGGNQPLALINPVITSTGGDIEIATEASLSFPGVNAQIPRPTEVGLSYVDRDGKACELTADGWLSRVIQHEVDYLDGKTFLDHLSPMKRKMFMKKYQKFRKHQQRHAGHGCGDPTCDIEH